MKIKRKQKSNFHADLCKKKKHKYNSTFSCIIFHKKRKGYVNINSSFFFYYAIFYLQCLHFVFTDLLHLAHALPIGMTLLILTQCNSIYTRFTVLYFRLWLIFLKKYSNYKNVCCNMKIIIVEKKKSEKIKRKK